MNAVRATTIAVLCGAVLMLWGCPDEQATETEPPQIEAMEPPAEEATTDHRPGEHMDGGHMHGDTEDAGAHHHGVTAPSDQALSGEVVNGTRVVRVEAKRYEFVPATIVVEQGRPVRLHITATDVMHGFDVEGMEVDVRLPPNETQTVEFTPAEAGEYHVHCSVYCGPGHGEMHGALIVRE
ncbi:MAG: cupredoxin domain-containing protein [Armatimonadota bacterium]|jgi:cytochrome c oxidase subunit 2